jgi:hypothetical protein
MSYNNYIIILVFFIVYLQYMIASKNNLARFSNRQKNEKINFLFKKFKQIIIPSRFFIAKILLGIVWLYQINGKILKSIDDRSIHDHKL